uniref:Uncharacterized protein n=1 Tax=Sphaerodactylus townsendi TaxID=933632 RepID=A0ACB8EDR5_9SAUR
MEKLRATRRHAASLNPHEQGIEEAQLGCGAASPAKVQSLKDCDVPLKCRPRDMRPQLCLNITKIWTQPLKPKNGATPLMWLSLLPSATCSSGWPL